MGTAGGGVLIDRVEKILKTLRAQEKKSRGAKEKQRTREKIQKIESYLLTVIDYTGIFQQAALVHQNMTKVSVTMSTAADKSRPDLEDILHLQQRILIYLEGRASIADAARMPPPGKNIPINYKILIYLDAITNVLGQLTAVSNVPSTFAPNVPPTVVIKGTTTAHHFAVMGYLDSIGQAIAKWGGGTYTSQTTSTDDIQCIFDILNAIAGLKIP